MLLIQLLQLFEDRSPGQRQVPAILSHVLLALTTEDVSQEFLQLRLNRLSRRSIDVNVNRFNQGIRSILEVFSRWIDVTTPIAGCHRERFGSGVSSPTLYRRLSVPVSLLPNCLPDHNPTFH